MTHEEIYEKVLEVIQENLEIDEELELSEETSFKDLGADSFDLLALVTSFEDEFELTLDDEVLENIQTIEDAVSAIEAAS